MLEKEKKNNKKLATEEIADGYIVVGVAYLEKFYLGSMLWGKWLGLVSIMH